MPFRFRPPTLDDAPLLLRWRTDPAITRFMYTDIDDPNEERQRAWLETMARRADFRHFVIEHAGRPIGYLSYSDIDRVHRRCSSGSYIGDRSAGGTVAGLLNTFILDYCFYGLGMHKIVNSFMAGNDAVIRIQRLLKFREVGVLRDHIVKYGRFHDVTLFEMTREEWESLHHPFPRDHTLAAFETVESDWVTAQTHLGDQSSPAAVDFGPANGA
mgnify:CR=1 FL=1